MPIDAPTAVAIKVGTAGHTAEAKEEPPRLSIVVLPFANISGDPEQEYFVDGVTESLTTDLSRISGCFVIARNTAFAYKGKPVDARAIGRELNVRYVLGGSVQRSGARMRVNVQLIDAKVAHISGPTNSTSRSPTSSTCRTKWSPASPATRRRTGRRRSPASKSDRQTPTLWTSSQGLAWSNKGQALEHRSQARSFFERALRLDFAMLGRWSAWRVSMGRPWPPTSLTTGGNV